MKKTLVLIPLLFCLLLSGCGNAARERFETFSQELAQRDALSFTAARTASYPDRTASFSLRYALAGDVQRVTVLSPGEISGITAKVEKGATALEYDGLILDTGDLDAYGLTPMSALPLLVEALRTGHPDAFWEEGGCDAVELSVSDHCLARVWFDGGIPCRAELQCDGVVTVACEIENWS